jgi:hypothetical protein
MPGHSSNRDLTTSFVQSTWRLLNSHGNVLDEFSVPLLAKIQQIHYMEPQHSSSFACSSPHMLLDDTDVHKLKRKAALGWRYQSPILAL